MQETQVQSLGRENPLEKGLATHSSTHAWRMPWTEDLASYRLWNRRESDMPVTNFPFLLLTCISIWKHYKCKHYCGRGGPWESSAIKKGLLEQIKTRAQIKTIQKQRSGALRKGAQDPGA